MDIGPPEILIFLVVVLVLFGGSQLPKFAKNLGKAQTEFKKGLADGAAEAKAEAKPETKTEAVAETPSEDSSTN